MTNERPPRGRPRPRGFDDVPELSPEEVERRVGVRGGAAPRVPIERTPRATRPARREERTTGRDSLLLVGLVVVGLVAVRVFLPEGPLTASATFAPSGTEAAVITPGPTGSPTLQTPVAMITLPPGSPEPSVVIEPTMGPTAEPTTPGPARTLKPGDTPRPTPRPTTVPAKTPGPTTAPSAPANAFLLVKVSVLNGDGGTATAAAWTIEATSSGSATPGSFAGSAGGTTVTLTAGATYAVTAVSGPPGYATSTSSNCSSATGGLPVVGQTETCTILFNDRAPRVTVYTIVDNTGGGTLAAADITVSVSGVDVWPSTSFAGSEAGVPVTFDAQQPFAITQSGGGVDYDTSPASDGCSGSGLQLGDVTTCTVTFTYIPPSPTSPELLLPFLIAPFLWPRRWRPTAAG